MPSLVQSYAISNDYDAVVKESEWQAIPNPASLTQLGKLVRERTPSDKKRGLNNLSDLEVGFNSVCISHEKIRNILERPDFRNKTLTAVGKVEWDLLRWSQAGMANKVTLLNEAAFVFTSAKDVEACGRSRQSLNDQKVNNRLLDCSDAHYLADSAEHNKLGKCFTWIKGEICFETLKQAYYEYDGRVSLSTDHIRSGQRPRRGRGPPQTRNRDASRPDARVSTGRNPGWQQAGHSSRVGRLHAGQGVADQPRRSNSSRS